MATGKYTVVTGASGFIGNAFARQLSAERKVVCLSRHAPAGDLEFVEGEFHNLEHLPRLDGFEIECVVHLGAVTGGCSEEDGLAVNVVGTTRLLRYALNRGCRKFVLASSIASIGCLQGDFVPLQIPILDEHPCLARDAYGFSKSAMEQVTRYMQRGVPDADIINLRLGAVVPEPPEVHGTDNLKSHAFILLGRVMLADVLRALDVAVNAPAHPGVRVYNVVGPDANVRVPVPEVLRASLGAAAEVLDFSWYERPGHEFDAVYAMDKIKNELGFVPLESVRTRAR